MTKHLRKQSHEAQTDFRRRREGMGLSREQLASMAGVSAATVYRIEMGRVAPHHLTVAAIKRALDLDEEEDRRSTSK